MSNEDQNQSFQSFSHDLDHPTDPNGGTSSLGILFGPERRKRIGTNLVKVFLMIWSILNIHMEEPLLWKFSLDQNIERGFEPLQKLVCNWKLISKYLLHSLDQIESEDLRFPTCQSCAHDLVHLKDPNGGTSSLGILFRPKFRKRIRTTPKSCL